MSDLARSLFTTPAMDELFAAEAHIQHMLRFEAALARAQARAGVIPSSAADAIAASCQGSWLDTRALYHEAATAGTPAIPLVRLLTARVPEHARGFVHWGATSQDVIDTALMLQMRAGLALLDADLRGVCAACATLAEQHRRTPMAGRTLLQQALPITFGLKAARWLALAMRQLQTLRVQREHSIALQCGGAVGTLAALGDAGERVATLLAEELELPLPDLPWHAERDRIAAIAATLGIAAGSLAKIAHDIVLLAQTEVSEVAEASAPGKGGSSAMPHKRNPVDAMEALAASRLATGLVPVFLSALANEHERAVGGWQAEWTAIPDVFRSTAGTIARVRGALEGLQVNAAQMRVNLDQQNGVMMAESVMVALAQQLGRPTAQHLVNAALERSARSSRTFRQALLDDAAVRAVLTPHAIDRALDPMHYLGSADVFIDRALASYQGSGIGGQGSGNNKVNNPVNPVILSIFRKAGGDDS